MIAEHGYSTLCADCPYGRPPCHDPANPAWDCARVIAEVTRRAEADREALAARSREPCCPDPGSVFARHAASGGLRPDSSGEAPP